MTTPTIALSVRLPVDVSDRLEKFTEKSNRSKTYITTKAVIEFLDRYEEFVQEILNKEEAIKQTRIPSQEETENQLISSIL